MSKTQCMYLTLASSAGAGVMFWKLSPGFLDERSTTMLVTQQASSGREKSRKFLLSRRMIIWSLWHPHPLPASQPLRVTPSGPWLIFVAAVSSLQFQRCRFRDQSIDYARNSMRSIPFYRHYYGLIIEIDRHNYRQRRREEYGAILLVAITDLIHQLKTLYVS